MKKIYLSILGAVCFATSAFAQPTTAPAAPSARDAGDVLSVYSEAYATSTPDANFAPGWGQATILSTEIIDVNEVKKMSGLNYQGLEFGIDLNVSSMEKVHIDLWSSDCTELDFYLIANGGGEKPKRLSISSGWNSYDIPLSDYELPLDKIWQFKLVAIAPATGSTVYYDNIYFYKSSSTPTITGFAIPGKLTTDADFAITAPTSNSAGAFTYTSANLAVATIVNDNQIHIVGAGTSTITVHQAADGGYDAGSATASFVVSFPPPTTAPTTPPLRNAADVISVYSEAYTNLENLDFNPGWGQSTQISEKTYAANKVQRMTNLNYQGLLLNADVDVSAMQNLHIDIFTPDCSSFRVTLIYKLLAGGQAEKFVDVEPTLNGWSSFDIPLSEYAVQDVNLTQVFQMKFESPNGGKTLFYDNIYFHKPGILPVSLTNFEAKLNSNNVALNWKTVSEANNKGFAVERSKDGKNWEQLGFVNGNNNSTNINTYAFADKNPARGVNYYRLVQEDNNGNKTPSDVKSISFSVSVTQKLSAYPNPVTDQLFVQVGVINTNNATLSLVGLKGDVVKSVDVNASNSNSTIGITVQGLQNGLYFLVLKDGADLSSTKIIVK